MYVYAVRFGAHLLDLKIGHIIYSLAQSAFVRAGAPELKTLNQSAMREHLTGRAYNLTEAHVPGKHADNMSAPCNPDKRLVFRGL